MTSSFKICDPIHGFIRYDEIIQSVIDSRPFQRLRYIHQMGVSYLVYPGATHARFEHSLGVMELATKIFDTIMAPHNRRAQLPLEESKIPYWRLILRIAALCHDMGHLPFSHTAEKVLLPDGGHEKMTLKMIQSDELRDIWKKISPSAEKDIIKLAVFPSEYALTPFERVLAQIITEDNFGADRIDYLIRDARYTGVGYGHFDYYQLIDCLRILPKEEGYTLGILQNGIQSVESLWIARYLMYARVYQHPKARIYTHHMKRFMAWHYKDVFSTQVEGYLKETDHRILTALETAKNQNEDAAVLLKLKPSFQEILLEKPVSKKTLSSLQEHFKDALMIDVAPQNKGKRDFAVLTEEGSTVGSFEASSFLREIPVGGKPLGLYADVRKVAEIKKWLDREDALESSR